VRQLRLVLTIATVALLVTSAHAAVDPFFDVFTELEVLQLTLRDEFLGGASPVESTSWGIIGSPYQRVTARDSPARAIRAGAGS